MIKYKTRFTTTILYAGVQYNIGQYTVFYMPILPIADPPISEVSKRNENIDLYLEDLDRHEAGVCLVDGEAVEARWITNGEKYYNGIVNNICYNDSTCTVVFDDNDVRHKTPFDEIIQQNRSRDPKIIAESFLTRYNM